MVLENIHQFTFTSSNASYGHVHASTLESSQAVVWLRETSQAATTTVATQHTEVHAYKLNISMFLSANECTLSASLAYLSSSHSCS